MKDEILYQLLLNPTPILIDLIYKKYKLMVIKFSSYIINKNFPRLKILEIDFSSYIVDAIQNMKKFKKEIFLKQCPQEFGDFIGEHYILYFLEKRQNIN